MKVLPVSFTPRAIENNNNPNFKAKYANPKYIKDIVCADCGRPVIHSERIFKAFKAVSRPLSVCLKKLNFGWYENNFPKAMELLRQFAQEEPQKNIEEIFENEEKLTLVGDAIREQIVTPEALEEAGDDPYKKRVLRNTTNSTLHKLQHISRGVLKGSAMVIKRFSPFKKYLAERNLDIFEQFQIYAQKYPKLRLSEITQLDEVYKFHKAKDTLQRGETNEKLNFHMANIDKLVLKINPEAKDKLDETKSEARNIIAEVTDPLAKKPMIKELYSKTLDELGCEKLKDKVFDEIKEFPTTFLTKDSAFVFYKEHNYNDTAIVDSIFAPFEASEEHNIALINGGKDNIFNKTVMHRCCNSRRGSRPYEEHIIYHPLMPYYTQQQFNQVCKEIIAGNLPAEYDYYPTRAAENLRECSNGKIDINLDDYCKKQVKKTSAKAKEIINEKIQIKSEIGSIEEEIRKLQEKVATLEGRNTELNRESRANKAVYKEIESYQANK